MVKRGTSRFDKATYSDRLSLSKRSQSQIITVVLIILLVLAAIVIVWAIILPMVTESGSRSEINAEMLDLRGGIEYYLIEDFSEINVAVRRDGGEKGKIGEVTGVKIIIEKEGGNYVYEDKVNFPDLLETKTYNLDPASMGAADFKDIKQISLYYIYDTGDEEIVSNLIDKAEDPYEIIPVPCPDGDGDGAGSAVMAACSNTEVDCDDGNEFIFPGSANADCDCDATDGVDQGQAELCDGEDNNCDGTVDDGLDRDSCQISCENDGYTWTGYGAQLNCCGDDSFEDGPYESGLEVTCDDGNDNDCDGKGDCADSDCFTDCGLIAYWNLDGDAQDSSGNGHHGTLNGDPTSIAGKIGQAYNFDGVNDYIDFGDENFGEGTEFTVALWSKGATDNNADPDFPIHVTNIIGEDNWNSGNGWYLGYKSTAGGMNPATHLSFVSRIDWNSGPSVPVSDYILDNWHHMAGVADENTHTLYIDKGDVAEVTINTGYGGTANNGHSAQIGRSSYVPRFFNGDVDEVMIFSKALIKKQIEALYRSV